MEKIAHTKHSYDQQFSDIYNEQINSMYWSEMRRINNVEDKWPCIKCTYDEYKNQIRDKLLEFGYDDRYISPDTWSDEPILRTCCIVSYKNYVDNEDKIYDMHYLCKSITEFLEAAKAKAIKNNWYKEKTTKEEISGKTALQEATESGLNIQGEPNFKIGDTVRILPKEPNVRYLYGYTDDRAKYENTICQIIKIYSISSNPAKFYYKLSNNDYYWPQKALELVKVNIFNPYQEFKLEEDETPKKMELKIRVKKPNYELTAYSNKKLFNILK